MADGPNSSEPQVAPASLSSVFSRWALSIFLVIGAGVGGAVTARSTTWVDNLLDHFEHLVCSVISTPYIFTCAPIVEDSLVGEWKLLIWFGRDRDPDDQARLRDVESQWRVDIQKSPSISGTYNNGSYDGHLAGMRPDPDTIVMSYWPENADDKGYGTFVLQRHVRKGEPDSFVGMGIVHACRKLDGNVCKKDKEARHKVCRVILTKIANVTIDDPQLARMRNGDCVPFPEDMTDYSIPFASQPE